MDITKFKSFVIEKLLLSLVHRHTIRDIVVNNNKFSISTDSHIINGIETESNGVQCLSIYIERNGQSEMLIKLFYSDINKYYEMNKSRISTFDADVISPLNNVFDDWDRGRLAVISFDQRDPIANLFRYRIAISQQNKLLIAKSKSGFYYAFLDTDMKQFIENRFNGVASNIILRRLNDLKYEPITPEMPFEPAIELFEDEVQKPVDKPFKYALVIVHERPLYWMKSPTRDVWIVILDCDKNHCRSCYMDMEPNMCHSEWSGYSVRKTNVHYNNQLHRYQIIRGKDCVDITHLLKR